MRFGLNQGQVLNHDLKLILIKNNEMSPTPIKLMIKRLGYW